MNLVLKEDRNTLLNDCEAARLDLQMEKKMKLK